MSILDQGRSPSFLPTQETDFDKRIRGELTNDDSSPRFEDWSPEKQRQAFEGLQREDAKRIALDRVATDFVALHPEYVDSVANGKKLNAALVARHGERAFTVVEFEQEYRILLANNMLQLNQEELKKQTEAAKQQRAQAELSRIVYRTEAELENMPLEEIRRLAVDERLRQLQTEGERGGFDAV